VGGRKEKDKDEHIMIEVLKAVNITITVFWDMTPCSIVTNVSEDHTANIFCVRRKNIFIRSLGSQL
jgi:hypothetical protein